MVKDAIGIIDLGLEGFSVAQSFAQNFRHEHIIYHNEMLHHSYLNITENEVQEIVKTMIKRLLTFNPKLIVVANDLIIDLAAPVLEDLEIPVLNPIQVLIDYLNINYEQKNIVLLAKNEILQANLYQKNIKYNRLYNIACDELEAVIDERMIKTSRSFYAIREHFRTLQKKEVDVVVTGSPYLINLKTEMAEYLSFQEVTDVGEIFVNKIKNEDIIALNQKGKGRFTICSYIGRKEFERRTYWSKSRYKYLEVKPEGK
jgi:glutamate racemase